MSLRRVVYLVVLSLLGAPFVSALTSGVANAAPTNAVQAAWAGFEQAVATATATAQAQPNAAGAQNQAYAAGFINELAQFDVDNQLLKLDPNHPVLFRNPDPFAVPMLAEPPNPSGIWNPDNVNYIAVISGSGTYELRGVRGNSVDLEFQAETGFPGDNSVAPATATFALPQLIVNQDGTYTLTIGGPAGPRNWLPTVPQTTLLSIRETYNDWANAVPDQFTLVRTDQTTPASSPSTAQLAAAINAASAQLIEEGKYWDGYWTTLLGIFKPNVVNKAAPTTSGLPNQISSLDHFHLMPGHALVINVAPDPNAGYQGIEVADDWGQTLPYAFHQSTLNGKQAYLGSDGMYHFIVSSTDPGLPNWIDTQGRTDGFVFMRWQHITGPFTSADSPTGGLVNVSDLASVLPPGTPRISSTQEVQTLRARDIGVARRILLSSNPAGPVLAADLGQIESQIGADALHTVYPPNVP